MESITIDMIEAARSHSSVGKMSDIMLEKCVALCQKYNVTPSELMNQLDAFLFSVENETLEPSIVGKFEQEIEKSRKQAVKERNEAKLVENRKVKSISPDVSLLKRSAPFSTPQQSKALKQDTPLSASSDASLSSQLSQNSGNFRNRTNRDHVVVKMNENLPLRGPHNRSQSTPFGARCRVSLTDSKEFANVRERYGYMYTTLQERANELDNHLLRLQEDMCKKANLEMADLTAVGIPSPDTVWVCGRVCNEASDGKINSTSVLLEGSRMGSGGRRIQLDLKELPQFAVFPGQILLVNGVNSSGRRMVVKQMLEGIPRPLPTSPPDRLLEYHYSNLYQGGEAMSVVVASGPFTTSDNLDYEPFAELLTLVLETKPDLLILTGPFVDSSQELLKDGEPILYTRDDIGEIEYGSEHVASYENVFVEKIIRDGLGAYFNAEDDHNDLPTNIVLIPSLLDAHHECVFPQPPFGDRDPVQTTYFEEQLGVLNVPFSSSKDPRKRVHLAPNPCMFTVNEVLFGVTSNDVLMALSSDEVSANSGHRMRRLAGHVLQQQSFYPQFPAPAGSLAQLDWKHAKHWQMNVTPDVLIIPSKLAPMTSDVLGTLVINPGQLTKGTNGGTYASVSINPIDKKTLQEAKEQLKETLPHMVPSRSNVRIIKI